MSDDALFALATKAGLEIDWVDAAGELHSVSPDTLRKVLDALDLPSAGAAQIAESSAKLDEYRRNQVPLVTAWAGEAFMAGGQVRSRRNGLAADPHGGDRPHVPLDGDGCTSRDERGGGRRG